MWVDRRNNARPAMIRHQRVTTAMIPVDVKPPIMAVDNASNPTTAGLTPRLKSPCTKRVTEDELTMNAWINKYPGATSSIGNVNASRAGFPSGTKSATPAARTARTANATTSHEAKEAPLVGPALPEPPSTDRLSAWEVDLAGPDAAGAGEETRAGAPLRCRGWSVFSSMVMDSA